MRNARVISVLTLAVSVAVSFLVYYLFQGSSENKISAAQSALFSFLFGGIAYLFVVGSKAFRREFARAYALIAMATMMLLAAVFQFTILNLTNAWNSWWVTSGLVHLPFLISVTLMFSGILLFAKLLNVGHLKRFVTIVLSITAILVVLALYLLLTRTSQVSLSAVSYYVSNIIQAVLLLAIVPLAFRVKKAAGTLYEPMFNWLFITSLVFAVQLVVGLVAVFVLPPGHWYLVYGTAITFFIAGICLLKVSFELNKIPFAEPVMNIQQDSHSSIDAIVYLAAQVSNPSSIDSILDGLRTVTSSLEPGETLNSNEQRQLARVYNQLEDFLVNQEKIGRFDKNDLRKTVLVRFGQNGDRDFWSAIKTN